MPARVAIGYSFTAMYEYTTIMQCRGEGCTGCWRSLRPREPMVDLFAMSTNHVREKRVKPNSSTNHVREKPLQPVGRVVMEQSPLDLSHPVSPRNCQLGCG